MGTPVSVTWLTRTIEEMASFIDQFALHDPVEDAASAVDAAIAAAAAAAGRRAGGGGEAVVVKPTQATM